MQFVINNWYLFLAAAVIIALLVGQPLRARLSGIVTLRPHEAVRIINRENAVLVDVREAPEYEAGHIPNALHIPLAGIADAKPLQKLKEKPVVLYCRSGQRSMQAGSKLRAQGFTQLYNLAGGIGAWQNENLPVERGRA